MNRNTVIEELLAAQAMFEAPSPDMTVTEFADRVRQLLDRADDTEPTRCAACLADAIHDSRIGTTAGDGGEAVVTYNGNSLCFEHFEQSFDNRAAK